VGIADRIVHSVVCGRGRCDEGRGDIDGRMLGWGDDEGGWRGSVLRGEHKVGACWVSASLQGGEADKRQKKAGGDDR